MKKIICLLAVLLLCMSLVVPALAAENEFVPSITYKDGVEVEDAVMDEEEVDDCIVVTSIKEADEKSTDISQEERDELIELYEKLNNGEMELPLDGDYIIREMVDVSFEYEDCRCEESHGSKAEHLKESGVTLTVTFDLGISRGTDLKVLVYVDGQWVLVEDVTINADGSVTVVFEDICPVVFCVGRSSGGSIPQTGDVMGRRLGLWFGLLGASVAAIVVLVVLRRKANR